MKKIYIIINVIFIYLFLMLNSSARESDYFKQGIKFFNDKKFEKSKIFFERDIVFYPKNEISYLYLAKIFHNYDNDLEQEMKLNSVLLLNPKNDEAIYMLTLLKIKQSNYNQAKELLDKFVLVCKSFCSKKEDIEEKFDKLIPEDAKNQD